MAMANKPGVDKLHKLVKDAKSKVNEAVIKMSIMATLTAAA